ncbi:MAG: DUF2752 domain-containing protein [Snowella sp.]|nr:DUF2752 domain-containing protein [Snowella sp.]
MLNRQHWVVTPLSSRSVYQHWIGLSIVSAPLIASYFYRSTSYSSPFFCPIRALTGIPCPGCGLTRSFIAICQGDWGAAFNHHFFGPILFLGFFLISLHLLLELIIGKSIRLARPGDLNNPKFLIFSLFLVLGYHASRLVELHQSGELMLTFYASPLGQFLFARGEL